DDCLGLGDGADMRDHYALRSAVEDPGGVMGVARAHPRDLRDADAECRDADRRGRLERGRAVLEVDVNRIEAASGGDHVNVRLARRLAVPTARCAPREPMYRTASSHRAISSGPTPRPRSRGRRLMCRWAG